MIQSDSLAIAALVGLLSGTHASIWGMYKDAVHEGFSIHRFARSMVVGCAAGVLLQRVLQLSLGEPGALVLLFGLAYALERGVVEVWKTFIRDEDQSKYFIPMQFSIRGVPVKDRGVRFAAGALYVVVVGLSLLAIARIEANPARWVTTVQVGLVVGLVIAVGGGWKDAPKEGFDPLKFVRSPVMTVVATVLLSRVTDSYLLMAIGAIGYERAVAETYKTFFFPSRPRGKFTGKPISHPDMLRRRQYFVPAYVGIWAAVLTAGMLSI